MARGCPAPACSAACTARPALRRPRPPAAPPPAPRPPAAASHTRMPTPPPPPPGAAGRGGKPSCRAAPSERTSRGGDSRRPRPPARGRPGSAPARPLPRSRGARSLWRRSALLPLRGPARSRGRSSSSRRSGPCTEGRGASRPGLRLKNRALPAGGLRGGVASRTPGVKARALAGARAPAPGCIPSGGRAPRDALPVDETPSPSLPLKSTKTRMSDQAALLPRPPGSHLHRAFHHHPSGYSEAHALLCSILRAAAPASVSEGEYVN